MGGKPCWEQRASEDPVLLTTTPRGTGVMIKRLWSSVQSFVMQTLAPVSAMERVDKHEVGVSLDMVIGMVMVGG